MTELNDSGERENLSRNHLDELNQLNDLNQQSSQKTNLDDSMISNSSKRRRKHRRGKLYNGLCRQLPNSQN